MPSDPLPPSAGNPPVIPESNPGTDLGLLLTAYFNSAKIGFCVIDQELRYVSINYALAEMNGRPVSDHLGKTLREILGEAAEQIEPRLREVFSGKPALNVDMAAVLPGKQGPMHFIEHIFPIMDAEQNISRVGVVVVESSERRKLQAAIRDLDVQLRRQSDRWQSLLDITDLLTSSMDVPLVFPTISARIRRVLQHEFAGFALQDSATGTLVRQSLDFPLSKGLFPKLPITEHDGPGAHCMRQRASIIFSKEELQGLGGDISESLVAEGMQSLCCVPMMRPTGPVGILVFGSTRQDAFHREDLQLLKQLAMQLALAIENQRAASEIQSFKKRLADERISLADESRKGGHFVEIVGNSISLKHVLDQVVTVATSEATVLILGETGTGKELIARAIHRLSRRKEGPFIKVNCAAIPTGLLESELFGHEKGAFTGAISQKVGRMEMADKGTLFLDEVGEIPLELQPKLLRVLQDQEFERLGSNHTIRVNVRLLAATNRDLAKSIAEHQFRGDLYYRLSVFPIVLPPLRERVEDIPTLVQHFVRKFAQRMGRFIETIPKETMEALKKWHWPGNIRELENLMERSVILSEGNLLRVPLWELQATRSHHGKQSEASLESAERQHILRVLKEAGGVLSGPNGAAKRLGLKRTTLQSKMQRLGINREDYLGPKR